MFDNSDKSQENIRPPHTTSASLRYIMGAGSDPGKRKKFNEDSILAVTGTSTYPPIPFGLFIVADGMGGYVNGQDASCRAIQAMADYILPKIVRGDIIQPETCLALLDEAVQRANKAVCQYNINLHEKEGADIDVGALTTVTAAMVIGSTAYIANVGNSRTYLYDESDGLKKITNDHSAVAFLIEKGVLTPEDLYTHRARNAINRALFSESSVEVDIFTVPLQSGDALLLCSYGLWMTVRDPEIENVLRNTIPDSSKAAEMLIQDALNGSGRDNVSAIVVAILEVQEQAPILGLQLFACSDDIRIPQG